MKKWHILVIVLLLSIILNFAFQIAQGIEYSKRAVSCGEKIDKNWQEENRCFEKVCSSWGARFDGGPYSWLKPEVSCFKNGNQERYTITFNEDTECNSVIQNREEMSRCMGWTVW